MSNPPTDRVYLLATVLSLGKSMTRMFDVISIRVNCTRRKYIGMSSLSPIGSFSCTDTFNGLTTDSYHIMTCLHCAIVVYDAS